MAHLICDFVSPYKAVGLTADACGQCTGASCRAMLRTVHTGGFLYSVGLFYILLNVVKFSNMSSLQMWYNFKEKQFSFVLIYIPYTKRVLNYNKYTGPKKNVLTFCEQFSQDFPRFFSQNSVYSLNINRCSVKMQN